MSFAFALLCVSLAVSASCKFHDPVIGDCVGGVIIDGVCEGKCSPSKCLADNVCVDNSCVLACSTHDVCFGDGLQSCLPAKEDDSDADIFVCQSSGFAPGMGAKCPFGDECADFRSCPEGGGCSSLQCDGDPAACVPDEEACSGQADCKAGKCPDGAACRVGCADDCAPWLDCQSNGEGDADAYCTLRDCQSDDECLAGFYCGIVRTPYDVCGPTCDVATETCLGGLMDGSPCNTDKECQKGNTSFCGETGEACRAPGQDGTTLFEGSLCMLRKSCAKRGIGAPCASPLDCSRVDGLTCAAAGGESRCTKACSTDEECLADAVCDKALSACIPRFGAWVGSGKFCEPCVTDEDCGSAGSQVACATLFGGVRACFDFAYGIECATDADCPTAPSGLHGACLDEGENITSADPRYHRCYLPTEPDSAATTRCW